MQCADCTELDANGYMEYDIIGKGNGYYFVNGNYIPIIWEKLDETAITKFYDINGNEVNIAKGKKIYPTKIFNSEVPNRHISLQILSNCVT